MDDPDLEHKIHQQQFMIEQQRQEELMRLQQVALAEKHREEQHHHIMMQQQQHDDEMYRNMQQEAMRHNHPPPALPHEQHQMPPHPLEHKMPPPHPHDQHQMPPHPLEHQMPPPHPHEPHQMPPHPLERQMPPHPHEHQMPHDLQQHMRRPPPSGPPPGPMPPPPPPPHLHPHLHGPPPPIGMLPPGVEDDDDRGGAGDDGLSSPPRPLMSLNVQPPPAMLAALGSSGEGGTEGGIGTKGDAEQTAAAGGSTTDALGSSAREVRLPMALEQALAFKTERAKQVGVQPEDIEGGNDNEEALKVPAAQGPAAPTQKAMDAIYALAGDEDDEEEEEDDEDKRKEKEDEEVGDADGEKQQRQSKNKRKKRRKKRAKERQREEELKKKDSEDSKEESGGSSDKKKSDPDVEVEYIQETLGLNDLDPVYRQFAHIFETFRIADSDKINEAEADKEAESRPAPPKEMDLKKVPKMDVDDSDDEGNDAEEEKKQEGEKSKLSKRKLKRLTRLSVAELKQLVSRPDVVEMHDVTARDPKLLVQLKAHRNTVAVPRHWCFKRKYLQGKRGIEKPPFDLPDFIKRTGIMEMRAALQEKEDQRTLKAKMRERARPKLGKIDIDYQKLHDAFFKWQTKPRMTIHGDLYYEGKEFETRLREKKPGELTEELRTALGMPVGPSAHKVPPPWLIAMQRYGPPPSYPNLKIAGLNAPIPDGCSFGYHAGGWGKPPVDESGRPLYGDVFGTQTQDYSLPVPEEDIDHTLWGELESESEEESEEEDDEEEEEEGIEGVGDGQEDGTGLVTPAEGLITPSGITSIPAGMETPEIIELRKRKIESDMEGGETPALFQVLPEKRLDRLGGAAMMASTHIYDMTGAGGPPPGVPPPPPPGRRLGTGAEAMGVGGPGTVELALDPSELDLVDTEAMAQRYEQTLREQQSQLQKEDLSDMLVEHVARQKNKRKRQQHQENKQAKKYKEFKF